MARSPGTLGGSIRAGDHNAVAVRVAHLTLPMVGATVALRRVTMAGQHDLDAHFGSALDCRIEVLHLEPEQYTIAVGSVGAIADGAVMMLDFKAVQLQDEAAILHQLLILPSAVSPAAAQQPLIPSAAGFDVRDTDERLRVHGSYPVSTLALASRYENTSETSDSEATVCVASHSQRKIGPPLSCPGRSIRLVGRYRAADLPVMPIGIDHSPEPPAMFVVDSIYLHSK